MGASPIDPITLFSRLSSEANQELMNAKRGACSGQPDWINRIIIHELHKFFQEEAAFKVLQDGLDTPVHLRDRAHFDAVNVREKAVRSEVSKAFATLRRLIDI